MLFKRGTGAISRMKMIVGMIICLLTFITGTANQIEPNVVMEITSEVTTQSTEINFVLENKGNATINQNISLKSFEKKVDGGWQEIPFDIHINSVTKEFIVSPVARCFFPGETVDFKLNIRSLFENKEQTTLDAGEYRITLAVSGGLRTLKAEEHKTSFTSCEFEVKAA